MRCDRKFLKMIKSLSNIRYTQNRGFVWVDNMLVPACGWSYASSWEPHSVNTHQNHDRFFVPRSSWQTRMISRLQNISVFDLYWHRSRLRRWHHRLTSGKKTRHSDYLIVDIQWSTSPTNHIWLSRRWHPDILSRCDLSHERSDRAELGLTYVDYISFRPGISVDNSLIRAIVWSVSKTIFCVVKDSIIRIFFPFFFCLSLSYGIPPPQNDHHDESTRV